VPHIFESAPSGRAKCRGCGKAIARGELRFGERLPNPFADEGEMTLWFHPLCAAYKRPEPLLAALAEAHGVPERDRMEQAARMSAAHHRLPRLSGAERAPTSQARCRHCREPIERESWRIRLVFYMEGRFDPGGFIHARCAAAYFESPVPLDQVLHFSAELASDQRDDLARELG
jgi:hypothetical protein